MLVPAVEWIHTQAPLIHADALRRSESAPFVELLQARACTEIPDQLLEGERRGFSGRLFMKSVQTESFPTRRPIWNATTAATTATIT